MDNRTKEWLTEQLLTIGSSAAGIIAGETPYPDSTPRSLYNAMVDAADGRLTEKHLNDDMKRGILTEPLHRDLLADELTRSVYDHDQSEFIYNEKYPWAHALPDGWTSDYSSDEKILQIPIQLKCPRVRSWHEIKLKGIHGHWLLGSQHALAVTGAPYEYFSVLNPETMRLIHFPVYRDEKLIERLMDMEKKFFAMFLDRTPPHSAPVERIELPPTTGILVTLETSEAKVAGAIYRDAKQLLNDAQALYDQAVTRIKELMGSAAVADISDQRFYRSHQQGRVSYDFSAMKKDGIDLEKYSKRGADYEQFRAFQRKQ